MGRLDRDRVVIAGHLVIGGWLVVVAAISDLASVGRLVLAGAFLLLVATGLALARRRGRLGGLACVLVGLLGLSSGAGIGLSWLATTGTSAIALLGTGAALAGVVLVTLGAWMAIRATPGWWRLAAIPIAFLLLQFGALPMAGAFYGTHPPRTPVAEPRPADATAVVFATPDGVELVAWYTPSRNGAAVIVLPGSGGAKGSTTAHAAVLARHGYGVLALDSRGTGDSGGIGNAWGWRGTSDIAGAIDWLATRPEVDPRRIAALGLSMGAEEALTAAAVDGRLAGVVAEGASARTADDLAYLPMDPAGVIQRLEAVVMFGLADLMTDVTVPMTLRDAVRETAVPVLLIVCDAADESGAAPLLQAASGTLQRWDVPEAPHIGALATRPEAWEERVIAFLDAALIPRTSGAAARRRGGRAPGPGRGPRTAVPPARAHGAGSPPVHGRGR